MRASFADLLQYVALKEKENKMSTSEHFAEALEEAQKYIADLMNKINRLQKQHLETPTSWRVASEMIEIAATLKKIS